MNSRAAKQLARKLARARIGRVASGALPKMMMKAPKHKEPKHY